MEHNKLKETLELHKKWLDGDVNGIRANLYGEDLRNIKLYCVDLSYAILQSVDLRGADLSDVCLKKVNFQNANLQCVDFYGANLQRACFQNADLYNAKLLETDLRYADLCSARNIPDLPWTSIVPEYGSFIGWKKVGNYIIKLKILDNAKRSNATGRKCRCSEAEVLEIQNLDGTKAEISEIYNDNYCGTNYVVGKTVTSDSFDDNRWNECSHGIHFFITRQEAVDYRKHSLRTYLLNK